MRVVIIEAVENGYVVRHRNGEDTSAVVFAGDLALKKVLIHLTEYFLAPYEETHGSVSFAAIAAIRSEEGALEPKKTRTPLPTESQLPRTQRDVKTAVMTAVEIQQAIKDNDTPFPRE